MKDFAACNGDKKDNKCPLARRCERYLCHLTSKNLHQEYVAPEYDKQTKSCKNHVEI